MEDEPAAVNVLAMGDSMSIDYGLLITINSTSGSSNCTRFKNGCTPREKLHFRFWPGDIGPSQTSQGLMALTVMLILLCLVITYCCWGTCCKLIQKRRSRNRRTRSQASFDSSGSCAWSPHHHHHTGSHHHTISHEMCSHHSDSGNVREQQYRNNSVTKPRLVRSELPPPPYETLFSQEISCAPPTYSSLELNQPMCPLGLHSESNEANGQGGVSTNSFVAVVIEQEGTVPDAVLEERQQERRFHRSQSVPALIDTSSHIKHIQIPLSNGNGET